jgi:hypothetical protein
VTVAGLRVTEVGRGAETLREPLAETPPAAAEILTWVETAAADVATANVAVD